MYLGKVCILRTRRGISGCTTLWCEYRASWSRIVEFMAGDNVAMLTFFFLTMLVCLGTSHTYVDGGYGIFLCSFVASILGVWGASTYQRLFDLSVG